MKIIHRKAPSTSPVHRKTDAQLSRIFSLSYEPADESQDSLSRDRPSTSQGISNEKEKMRKFHDFLKRKRD